MFSITNDDQRQKTLEHIKGLKAQIERIRQKHGPEQSRNFQIIANRKIDEFEEQIKAYDRFKWEKLLKGEFRCHNT